MLGELQLVHYGGQYMVCRRVLITGQHEPREVWVYGPDDREFCAYGFESAAYVLPTHEDTNFFRDRFPFAIDRQSRGESRPEKVGGMINIRAANAAFSAMLADCGPDTLMRLRHGSQVIDEAVGIENTRPFLTGFSRCTVCKKIKTIAHRATIDACPASILPQLAVAVWQV